MRFSALLEQITVLIGISYKGRPIAGIVHQPYYGKDGGGRTVWAVVGVGVHGIKISNGLQCNIFFFANACQSLNPIVEIELFL